MSQTFCTSCGTALPAGAAFCGGCGTPVDAGASRQSAPETAPPPPAPEAPAPVPPPAAPSPPPVYAAPPEPAPAYTPPSAAPAYAPPPAAPAYPPAAPAAPAFAAATPLNPEYEQRARAYVGQNADYYLGKWRQIDASGKPNSWNWAAFFLSAFWLAYRKMFGPALAVIGAILLLQLVGLFSLPLRNLASGLQLGVCAFIGWRGNAMYRAQADRAIAQASTIAPDPNGQAAWLQAQGGVSVPGALGVLGGFVLIWFLLVFVIAAQMGLGRTYRSSYSSTYSPSSTAYPSTSSLDSGIITTQFLQGAQWAPNCRGAGAYVTLNPNGYFTSSVGSGSWSLIGNVLNLAYSNGQPPEAMTLRRLGPNQVSFTEGARSGILNRC